MRADSDIAHFRDVRHKIKPLTNEHFGSFPAMPENCLLNYSPLIPHLFTDLVPDKLILLSHGSTPVNQS